ncbi:YdbC family protein [Tuberibacillus sp. Marseille-P3662]|uniref:YdbC family protein n=1 Tax=Tuberibacillus sp. Marseille-P3662 TaxID=1965358 RepID=UPI000A1CB4EE|nr:PC4/YdbC family ssDNA-binding protein [Tuberibacillus sp. Marseille-P3662]
MAEFKFDVVDSFGTLSQAENGWSKQLTIVSWNDREPKYDIRSWSPERKRMGRGVTFSKDELSSLKKLLNNMPV